MQFVVKRKNFVSGNNFTKELFPMSYEVINFLLVSIANLIHSIVS